MSSPAMTVTLRDGGTPAVEGLVALVRSRGALIAGGDRLRESIGDNLLALPPNKNFPGQTTSFWGRTRGSMTQPIVEGESTVRVSLTEAGARYQYLGGTITAKDKLLTIPAREEAYGKGARDFDNLKVVRLGIGPSGNPILALVEKPGVVEKGRRARKGALAIQRGTITGGLVMYWLAPSVSKGPNPEVLPPEGVMRGAFAGGIRSYVNGRMRNTKALTPESLN